MTDLANLIAASDAIATLVRRSSYVRTMAVRAEAAADPEAVADAERELGLIGRAIAVITRRTSSNT